MVEDSEGKNLIEMNDLLEMIFKINSQNCSLVDSPKK